MKTPVIVTIIVLFVITGGAVLLTRTPNASSGDSYATSSLAASSTPLASNPSTATMSPAASPTVPADAVSAKAVTLKTSMGDIHLTLFPEDAPLAVQNFVTLGKRGYYNGIIFHRVIKDFMIQGGDPTGTGSGGESIYGQTFKTEINSHQFVAGTLGAARTSQMDTNGSQFFITAVDYHSLDNQYTVFGQVADDASLQIVKAIDNVPTDSGDKPKTDVKISGFEITQQ